MSDWNEKIRDLARGFGSNWHASFDGLDVKSIEYHVASQTCGWGAIPWHTRATALAMSRCESPIETGFLASAMVVWSRWVPTYVWFGPKGSRPRGNRFIRPGHYGRPSCWEWIRGIGPERVPGDRRIVIYPQMTLGKYRADFLVVYRERSDGQTFRKTMVVECDGHDYHERTKEQASRDKARDRWMQAEGHMVNRFTGSDIWADPFVCVADVLQVLIESAQDDRERFAKAVAAAQ